MTSPDRTLSITIDGDLAINGRVPIDILASKWMALQNFVAAAAKLTAPVFPKKKNKNDNIAQAKVKPKDASRLFFKDIKKNCLTLVADLPNTDMLFEDEDWGVLAADMAGEFLRAVKAKNKERLAELVPDHNACLSVMRKAIPLLPISSDHTIAIKTPHQSVRLTSKNDECISECIESLKAQFSVEQSHSERTITGKVTLIDKEANPPIVGVRSGSSALICELSPDVSTQIEGDLAIGTLIEITGEAFFTEKGKLHKILNASRYRQLGQEPIRWTRLTYEDREFILARELVIKVTGNEEGWVFESEELGIIGYGLHRQEAHLAFRQDFAACWDIIACEADDRLTQDAIDMKNLLKSFVLSSGNIE